MYDKSLSAARRHVIEGNFNLAVPGALYAIRAAERIYGVNKRETIAAHLLLAEIYLGTLNPNTRLDF